MTDSSGIHGLPEAELLRLVKAIARADFAEPVSRSGLVLAKFGHLESELDVLVGHDKRAALAIVSAVLRERQRTTGSRASIAWSGPSPTGHGTRAPYELLQELIATAGESVLFTGVTLSADARLLRSLHAAQRGRSLQVRVVLARDEPGLAEAAHELFSTFRPWPVLYVPNPERLQPPLPLSLIVDQDRAVVLAGAHPEVDGPEHDLCAGIVLEDAERVRALVVQWQTLIDTGALLPLMAAHEAQA